MTNSYWRAMVGAAFEYEPERPPNRDTARAAAIELQAQGLTVADISAALKVSEEAIRQLLGMAEGGA
jgi:DNA-binding NarL/FixJ family response regulator